MIIAIVIIEMDIIIETVLLRLFLSRRAAEKEIEKPPAGPGVLTAPKG